MNSFVLLFPILISVCVADQHAVSSMTGAHRAHERLVGSNKCTWGPSFWCDKIANAKQCSAVTHCVQSVWGKQAEPSDDSILCRWCDDLMDDIRDLVAVNTSESGMHGYLRDGCKRIPKKSRRADCLADMTTDLPEIRQMLSANVPDRTICKTINFCSLPAEQPPAQPPTNLPIPAPAASNRNYCADCYNFFEDAKEIYIGNYTEDEFKQMLLDQCDQAGYPALTELCKTVIEQYWPQIYARLQMFFDPEEVCSQLNFCTGMQSGKAKWWLPLVPYAQRKTTKKMDFTPIQLPLTRMLLNLNSLPAVRASSSSPPPPKKVAYKNDVECVVCEFVMSYLDRMLEDNYTEAAIQSALERVCTVMPKSVRDDCVGFIDQYGPAILVILGNELDPATVCAGLGLCKSKKPEVCGAATCTSCTEVFKVIKVMLEDYDENVRLSNLIKSYCVFFPEEARTECETAVMTYVPYVLQIAAQLLDPEGVCRAVKLCDQ